jgi:hypothetical protein
MLQVGGWSSRLPGVRLTASASLVAVDTAARTEGCDYEQLYGLRASVRAWLGGSLVGALAYSHPERDLADTSQAERRRPVWDGYVDLAQALPSDLGVQLRYGILWYRDERPDHFAWYHLVKLVVVGRI